MPIAHRPLILIVLDGWGYAENIEYNAIHSANKPTWDRIWEECPHTLIRASGIDVGLPDQQMGNSEVGHMNIGSGRVVDQEFTCTVVRAMPRAKSGARFKSWVAGSVQSIDSSA